MNLSSLPLHGFSNPAMAKRLSVIAIAMLVLLADRPAAFAAEKFVLAFGDSLTAGYRLPPEKSFPRQLQQKLRALGHDVTVANAGVSGDTTAGGKRRLAWALKDKPDLVILELGANDALRGIKPAETLKNLDAMMRELKERGIRVLLAGMFAPPNMGRKYASEFDSIYPLLARRHGADLYPFFLSGVATRPHLNLRDGVHPNAEGIAVIVERITPYVLKALAPE
jgi:acyl-CoA thioesterase-1